MKVEGETLAYPYRREPPCLNSPFDGLIGINSAYAFASNALRWDLRFNQEYLEKKLAIKVLLRHAS